MHVFDLVVFLSDFWSKFVNCSLQALSVVLTFVSLSQTCLISRHLFIKCLNVQVELFDLLSQCLLNRIGVQKALDFLLTEQELVLDESLHVRVAVDDGFEQLCEVGALGALCVLLDVSVDADFLGLDRYVVDTRR